MTKLFFTINLTRCVKRFVIGDSFMLIVTILFKIVTILNNIYYTVYAGSKGRRRTVGGRKEETVNLIHFFLKACRMYF